MVNDMVSNELLGFKSVCNNIVNVDNSVNVPFLVPILSRIYPSMTKKMEPNLSRARQNVNRMDSFRLWYTTTCAARVLPKSASPNRLRQKMLTQVGCLL